MRKLFFTATKLREMEAIVASGDIGPATRETVALMLKQSAEIQERAYSERMCALALGHHSLANKIDRIIVGVDSNGKETAVAGVDYDPADASEDKKAIKELVAALKALAADACGHCDARYCQATCHNGEPQIPCRVVYEEQELVRRYSPKEDETPPESDDSMPF